MVRGFNHRSGLQHRRVTNILDNCSAHAIEYTDIDRWDAVFLPPNTTSLLQPFDATIGRSFKCAFQRLLVDHLLAYWEKRMESAAQERPIFKINEAVTTYDVIRLMKEAWDLVPDRVVLNAWVKTDILAPLQLKEIVTLRDDIQGRVTVAENAFIQSVSSAGATIREEAQQKAYRAGEAWVTNELESVLNEAIHVPTETEWQNEVMDTIGAEVAELSGLQVLESFSDGDMQNFMDEEDDLHVCEPVTADDALQSSVASVFEDDAASNSGTSDTDDVPQEGAGLEISPKASVPRLYKCLQSVRQELGLLLQE